MGDPKIEIQRTATEGGWLIRLAGAIDEGFRGDMLTSGVSGIIVYDLDAVRRITYFGLREWGVAINKADFESFAFVRCRPVVVGALNTVSTFAGKGQVLSLYAPCVCNQCRHEHELLIDLRAQHRFVSRGEAPPLVCPDCGGKAELKEPAERYFAFLAGKRPVQPHPIAERILATSFAPARPFEREQRLRVERLPVGDGWVVRLSGVFDERVDRNELIAGLRGPIAFDLDGVRRMTSFGVREWILSLRQLGDAEYAFLNCREVVVRAFNTITDFGGKGALLSFYVPYVCPQCRKEIDELLDLRLSYSELMAGQLSPVRCPKCSAIADLDESPDIYFSFVREQGRPVLSPGLEQVVTKARSVRP
jgi:rubrerythrin